MKLEEKIMVEEKVKEEKALEKSAEKSILKKEGYNVDVYLHGLGENLAVQNLFVKKASQAWEALQAVEK